MASTLMVLTAATMFLSDSDPNTSLHLALKKFKIPQLKAKTKEHYAGGAAMAVNINLGILEPLEFTFKLEGFNQPALAQFLNPMGPQNYTVRGNIRDVVTQENQSVVAVIRGTMTRVESGEYSPNEGFDSDFAISEVLAYRLFIAGKEIHYFDWAQGPSGVRINGQPLLGDVARNLGLV